MYRRFGEEALKDRKPCPRFVWNRNPDDVQGQILDMALKRTDLNPRKLAATFTDAKSCFVSEASFYKLLQRHDLITSPNFIVIVIKAASEFKDKTTAINQLWQTGFPYLKSISWGRGWCYLSAILNDFSRYIIS